jgi:hypothetical protein
MPPIAMRRPTLYKLGKNDPEYVTVAGSFALWHLKN